HEQSVAGDINGVREFDAALAAVRADGRRERGPHVGVRFADDATAPAAGTGGLAVIAEEGGSHAAGGDAEGLDEPEPDDEEDGEDRHGEQQNAAGHGSPRVEN